MKVDVFYCEGDKAQEQHKSRATAIINAVNENRLVDQHGPWRARAIPRTINDLPGYQANSYQVRFNPQAGEETAAKQLADLLSKETKRPFELRKVAQASSGYLSAFLCGDPKP